MKTIRFFLAAALTASACSRAGHPAGVVASGHVEATDVRLAAEVPGRVLELTPREGDALARGDVAARIDASDAELLLRQVRAERDAADAELRLRLAGARREDVAEAEARLRAVASDLAAAEQDLVRLQALLDKGSGTPKARDDAKARRDVLAAQAEAARQVLERLRAGSRREEIDSARARRDAAEARIAQLEKRIRDAVVVSPISGVVTEKLVESGEVVAAGTPLLVLADLARPWLTVYVDEPDLAQVRLGGEAEVRLDDGTVRRGRVGYVSPKAEFTPKNVQTRDERVKLVFKVKVELDNPDGLFKPGMPAEARFLPPTATP